MRTKTIVIARTAEDSEELAQFIRAHSYEPLVEPVLSVEYLNPPMPDLRGDEALIFTSANGVQGWAAKTAVRTNPVYAVGRNTADEAMKLGFSTIETAAGTVEDLVQMLKNPLKTTLISPIYVRGEQISQDLVQILGENGLKCREIVVYRTNPAENLSVNLLRGLDDREIAAIMFFSSKGAQVFAELIEQYGRENRLRPTKALCISEAVLKSLSVLPFRERLVADKPDRYGMMKLLENLSINED